MPLTHKEIMRILSDYEFLSIRCTGSHERFEKNGYGVTIPFHREFAPKTGKAILETISLITGASVKEIIKKYKLKL